MADNLAEDSSDNRILVSVAQASREPPIVASALGPPSKLASRLEQIHREMNSEVYGTPRVFDLYTMMAVTLAFALLFGFMRLLEPILAERTQSASVSISVFVTGIAIAQLALWHGRCPRRSSLVAGPLLWVAVGGGMSWLQGGLPWDVALTLTLCTAPIGLIAGYLAGAVAAGVFLVADAMRFKSKTSPPPAADDARAESFDRIE